MNITKRIQWLSLLATLFIAGPALADRATFDISGTGAVGWVADGDTVRVQLDDPAVFLALRTKAQQAQRDRQRDLQIHKRFDSARNSVLIRIAGINTDESVHPDPSRNTQSGIRASDYAKRTFTGPVTVRCAEIGYYGRPICAVSGSFGDWGKVMIRGGFTPYVQKYGRHPFDHRGYLAAERGE